jgi:ribosomal protein L40E
MGAEFMVMNAGDSDHSVTLTIAGEAENLRPRLVRALERLGYTVTSEQPILARRGARRGARWGWSWDVLEYPARLTVGLRQHSPNLTLVSFDYEIKNPFIIEGDRKTLAREAEAIIAVAMQHTNQSMCMTCGTEATDDSRFCRRCGAPMTGRVAELEILRLTDGTRTGHQQVVAGAFTLLLTMITFSIFLIFSPVPLRFTPIYIIGSILGLLLLFTGVQRTHRTLNPKEEKQNHPLPAAHLPPAFAPPPATAPLRQLSEPAPRIFTSVTESTTELLDGRAKDESERMKRSFEV